MGRGLRLTEVGEVLLEQAKIMRRTMDDFAAASPNMPMAWLGTVRLGVSPAAAKGTLPRLLQRLLLESPHIRASLIIELSDRLRAALRELQIDVIIGPTGEDDNEEFVSVPLTTDVMVVSARAGHPLVGRRCALEELVPYRWRPGPVRGEPALARSGIRTTRVGPADRAG